MCICFVKCGQGLRDLNKLLLLLLLLLLALLLLKPAAQPKWKKHNCLYIAFATPQAPTPRKTEKQAERIKQRLTAPFNPSNV